MSKDIDKLFKDQLSDRSFEWKESYWQEAEAAILAAEKNKRRRRFFFFFWLTGALAIASGLLMFGLWQIRQPADLGRFPVEQQGVPSGPKARESQARPSAPLAATEVEREKEESRSVSENVVVPLEADIVSDMATENAVLSEMGEALSFLSSMPFMVEHAEMPSLRGARPSERRIEPQDKSFRWSAGLSAGGRVDMQGHPGAWAGALCTGPLFGKWNWMGGMQYAVLQTPRVELERTQQIEKGFGASRTAYVSIARSVHQIELPAGLQYRLNRSVFLEAGAQLSMQTAARGQVEERTSPLPWERTAAEQSAYEARLSAYYNGEEEDFPAMDRSAVYGSGWLPAGSGNPIRIYGFAGAQIQMGKGFSMMGRLNYRFAGMEDPSHINPLSLSLGAVYWMR